MEAIALKDASSRKHPTKRNHEQNLPKSTTPLTDMTSYVHLYNHLKDTWNFFRFKRKKLNYFPLNDSVHKKIIWKFQTSKF